MSSVTEPEIAYTPFVVAKFFKSKLSASLIEVYKVGSLAHGGFSPTYSDIDVALILGCASPPDDMDSLLVEATTLDPVLRKRLSVFWGNPEQSRGRLGVLDHLDLLDNGIPILNNVKPSFQRPSNETIRKSLLDHVENSWKKHTSELSNQSSIASQEYRRYLRCLLFPARLIYTWKFFKITSSDMAVEYLRTLKPPNLDLKPIELSLGCRHGKLTPEEIFSNKIDLRHQFDATISYISAK